MYKLILISLFILAIAIQFTSCQKEEVDFKESEILLDVNNNYYELTELNLFNNELSIKGRIDPTLFDDSVTLKISSSADTAGIIVRAELRTDSYVEGKFRYNYKSIWEVIDIANFTDQDKEKLKVNSPTDMIVVKVIGQDISATYPVNCEEVLHYNFWNMDNAGTLWLYGYDYNGTETKTIKAWSDIDQTKITLKSEFSGNLPSGAAPDFDSYKYNFDFVLGHSSQQNNTIAVDTVGKVNIYFEFNGKTYVSDYQETVVYPLPVY